MTDSVNAPPYVAGTIERALAEDPRTHELGIRADIRNDVVYLRGEVAGEERRQLITEVVAEVAPHLTVRNEVSVAEVHPPGQEERLP
jgi:osmotically-inducible protein OsmY